MASKTRIGWTDRTFNAWMGCTKVSGGCKNCYAETFTKNRMGLNVWGPRAPRQRTKGPWKDVLRWQREAASGEVGADGVAGRLLEDPKCWARSMLEKCRAVGAAYFHKQSAGPRNETGVELDGEIIHEFPVPRALPMPGAQASLFGAA